MWHLGKNKPHGPKAAWLDKQNKQLPVALTSMYPLRFAKRGGRGPPHGGGMRSFSHILYWTNIAFLRTVLSTIILQEKFSII